MTAPGPIPTLGPPLIGAGAELAGGVIRNKAQRAQAREQMDFQERMSNTAYQRAVEDMRLAGINPMLAYMQGGATSPSGAMAQIEDVVGPAVSSAKHSVRLAQELKNMKATERDVDAAARLKQTQQFVAGEQVEETRARTKLAIADTRMRKMSLRMMQAEMPRLLNLSEVQGTKFGKVAAYLQRFREIIYGGGSAVKAR